MRSQAFATGIYTREHRIELVGDAFLFGEWRERHFQSKNHSLVQVDHC